MPETDVLLCPALQAASQLGSYMFKPSGAAMLRPLALVALLAAAVLLNTAIARCAGLWQARRCAWEE